MFLELRCQTPPLQHCIYCSLPCYCTPLPQSHKAHTHTHTQTQARADTHSNICREPTLLAGSLMLLYGAGVCSLQPSKMRSVSLQFSYCKPASHTYFRFCLKVVGDNHLKCLQILVILVIFLFANRDAKNVTNPTKLTEYICFVTRWEMINHAFGGVKHLPAWLYPNNVVANSRLMFMNN